MNFLINFAFLIIMYCCSWKRCSSCIQIHISRRQNTNGE